MTLPYVKCDPCCDGDHQRCKGRDETEPLCGCSMCPWLLEGTNDHPSDDRPQFEQSDAEP